VSAPGLLRRVRLSQMYLGGPRAHDRFNFVLDVLDYVMRGRTGVSLGASLVGRWSGRLGPCVVRRRRVGRQQRSEDRTGPASGGGRRPHLTREEKLLTASGTRHWGV
jgi:hypothetical protein